LEPCLPAIHSCCRSTAWSHLTPSICGFNAKRGGNKSEYFGIYVAKIVGFIWYARNMKNTTKTMKHTEKKSTQWKLPNVYMYIIWSNVTPGSRKYSILSVFVFLSLIKAQKITLNNWKALKNNEKWWNRWKKIMKNYEQIEKTMKHNEK